MGTAQVDCRAVLEEVNNYLDRQVDRFEAEQIELHLACCPNCRIVYDTVAKTVRLYCEDRQPVTDAVRHRIRQALKAAAEEPLTGPLEATGEPGFSILRIQGKATVSPEQAVEIYSEARQLSPELHDRSLGGPMRFSSNAEDSRGTNSKTGCVRKRKFLARRQRLQAKRPLTVKEARASAA